MQIGFDWGFYDYADRTDNPDAAKPDLAFGRFEREYPLVRDELAANDFRDWLRHKAFLLDFMQMLFTRSPLGMEQYATDARNMRVSTIVSVGEDRRALTVDSLEGRPLTEHEVRNFAVSKMLQDIRAGAERMAHFDWCLRYADEEKEGYCTTDQAVFVEGPPQPVPEEGRVTEDMLRHPEAVIFFPLSWQACLFGSSRRFDKVYDRTLPQDVATLRSKQKQYASRFVVSPMIF